MRVACAAAAALLLAACSPSSPRGSADGALASSYERVLSGPVRVTQTVTAGESASVAVGSEYDGLGNYALSVVAAPEDFPVFVDKVVYHEGVLYARVSGSSPFGETAGLGWYVADGDWAQQTVTLCSSYLIELPPPSDCDQLSALGMFVESAGASDWEEDGSVRSEAVVPQSEVGIPFTASLGPDGSLVKMVFDLRRYMEQFVTAVLGPDGLDMDELSPTERQPMEDLLGMEYEVRFYDHGAAVVIEPPGASDVLGSLPEALQSAYPSTTVPTSEPVYTPEG